MHEYAKEHVFETVYMWIYAVCAFVGISISAGDMRKVFEFKKKKKFFNPESGVIKTRYLSAVWAD